jgi:malonyl-CoA/methylmalonyl-CoA synthetase
VRKKGTVGYPLPTVDTRIVDEHGAEAATGELWIRGPSVFRGYHEREEATREAFVRATDGGAPWFKTGDTVTRDEDGAFRILGRTSVDILKSGGYKLSALEIEAAILELDAVREVAVVGVPDEAWGERVIACVVPAPGRDADCSEERVRAHVRERLAPYKCPKEVRLFTELPRNAMGKVMKRELARDLGRQENGNSSQ